MFKHKQAKGLILWYMKLNNYDAWTSFWSTIYFIDEKSMDDKCLIEHEMTHVRQIKELGYIRFSIEYLYQSFRYGYYGNKFEIEAYKNQYKCKG